MHDREHEERLAALLAGELEPSAGALPPALEACPTCRERWQALGRVAARVGAAGAAQRDRLAELAHLPREAEEAVLAAALARLAATQPHAAPRPRRAWLVAAVAAALCLGLWLGSRLLGRDPAPVYLDAEEELLLVRPLGEKQSFEVFEWTCGPKANSYDLAIYSEEGGERLKVAKGCIEKTWRPDAALLASLPRHIFWKVTAYDALGVTVGSKSGDAWSSH